MKTVVRCLKPLQLFLVIAFCSLASYAQEMNADEFDKAVTGKTVQLLDVRTAEEYKDGHLKQSLQADWLQKEQFRDRVQYLDKQQPLYVYCLSGGRSGQAAKWLRDQGFTQVITLTGGVNTWKKSGKLLEGAPAVPEMTETAYDEATRTGWVLVDFGAAWCPPCKKMEPVVQKVIAKHPTVKLFRVDGGINTTLMKKYNVEALPVFLLYKDGKMIWRQQGLVSEETFNDVLKTK